MSNCTNIVVREQLPDFMHGLLNPQEQRVVQIHLVTCEDCTAEFALLQAIRSSRQVVRPAMQIDASQIVAVLPGYQAPRRMVSYPLRLAAAFLIAAVGIATFAMTRGDSVPDTIPQSAIVATTDLPETTGAAVGTPNGITLVSVDGLSDEQLKELIAEVQVLEPGAADIYDLYEMDLVESTAFGELEDI